MKETQEKSIKEKTKVVETGCKNKKCPFHGNLRTRGRIFEGEVIKKFPTRIVLKLERMVYVKKYERYKKSQTKIHAQLPNCMEKEINKGDLVRVRECRPLSKIIHFVVIKKLNQKIKNETN